VGNERAKGKAEDADGIGRVGGWESGAGQGPDLTLTRPEASKWAGIFLQILL
jgi:hypothetical protein